jgi:leucyl aminopeptidase
MHRAAAQAVLLPVFQDEALRSRAADALDAMPGDTGRVLRSRAFEAKEGQTLTLFPSGWKARFLILTGLGPRAEFSLERVRRAVCAGARAAQTARAETIAVVLTLPPGGTPVIHSGIDGTTSAITVAIAEGAALCLYRFGRYITRSDRRPTPLRALTVLTAAKENLPGVRDGVSRARVLVQAVALARDLANAPGNEIFPDSLARRAAAALRGTGARIRILNERRIAALGMGGIQGVGAGSARPPRFIIIEWGKARAGKTIVLVGKGVTFDSGGISIKPSANMAEMKMDMSGAAAVIGTMVAVSRLRIPLHIVGLIPAVENLPGGRALKPGDILTHMNGMTTEVDNTDAEGRLILADALCYAQRFKPALIVDIATLTGAIVVALAHLATGMLGTAGAAMERLKASGERTYERVWQMPLFEEYDRLIQSEVADVKNSGGRWGGAITAAMFLKNFVGGYPWVHLDIAGTAMMEETFAYLPKGGSGVGVRLLVDFLRHWTAKGTHR